ncbi:cilia- and flagella-associated protein 157-like [Pecten maximus]|uniref:cilia- and flagella-associated protein 157-like n=1 Tax=Pecten maximus TaxID=6579 RepID=UPI0014586664|nr:cilia- and flagella-associated protein 157-like [Pecten maximus]
MPPKKKKSGKKGKKSGKSGRGSPSKLSGDSVNEMSKDFIFLQIRDLEHQLMKYKAKAEELEENQIILQEKHDEMARENADIEKLNVSLTEQEKALIMEEINGVQTTREEEKEWANGQINQIRQDFQDTKETLTSENSLLSQQLNELEDFKLKKEERIAMVAAMEEHMKQSDEDQKYIIENIRLKAIVDKDRLKKEMVDQVNQRAADFRKVSNKQMADTTKRAIRENVSIRGEIIQTTDKTEEFKAENDEVRARVAEQEERIKMLEEREKELTKNNSSSVKIIKMLKGRSQNMKELLEEMEMRDHAFQDLDGDRAILVPQVEAQRLHKEQLIRDNKRLREEIRDVKGKLRKENRDMMKLGEVLSSASTTIREVLTKDAFTGTVTPVYGMEEEDNASDRKNALLEELLGMVTMVTTPKSGKRSPDKYRIRKKSASEIPGKNSLKRGALPVSPIAIDARGTQFHYQPGDLGMIPRPENPIPTSLEKMRVKSATTRLGELRKMLTNSVGVQTVSAPKSLYYADQLLDNITPRQKQSLLHEQGREHSRDQIRSRGTPMGSIGPASPAKRMLYGKGHKVT